jgi:hypothetical protein
MRARGEGLRRRADSLLFRIRGLASLRQLVNLSSEQDITPRQWSVLEMQLNAASALLTTRTKAATDSLLPRARDASARRKLNAALGQIELDLSRAYTFFDTYMDVLTQRRSGELGPVLAGCDVLAYQAMRREHPTLTAIEAPLVFCDRGFGAAIVRESVAFPDGTPNPMPLIQIPYSRLREKCNLTSVLHEAGHQSLTRLQLVAALPLAFRAALTRAGAPKAVCDLYALWAFEIGPDFWGFCLSGVAQAAAMRELFAMPPSHALRLSVTDPHPPPYLRVLLSFDWCRRAFGRGRWDAWEQEWELLYPLTGPASTTRTLLQSARRFVPVVGDALFNYRFRELENRALVDLFDLTAISPAEVRRVAEKAASGVLNLRGLTPCAQLAVFAELREMRAMTEERLDDLMTVWLRHLGERRPRRKTTRPLAGK